MPEKKLQFSAPWIIFSNRVKALFRKDPEVMTEYDDNEKVLTIRVDNGRKYDAICHLFPLEKTFGNVTVKIQVVPANEDKEVTWADLFKDAFAGNPIFAKAEHMEGDLGGCDYVLFKPEVVQYYSDNFFDYYGLTTELYQDLAKEVFDTESWDAVQFCTSMI